VRVEINSSPFQQGKLLLHYIPCYSNFVSLNAKFGQRTNAYLEQKVQHPHAEITCDSSCVSLRIPYVSPSHYYGIKEGYYDWGTWFLDVFSPLMTGAAAPASQLAVDYLIYGYFENVELGAPIIPQSGKRERRVSVETKENQGPIEEGLRKVGKTAAVLDDVPILSEFSKPLVWASDIAAKMAHIWGWSKPRELNGVSILGDNFVRYAGTVDGPSLAVPGGAKCDNRLRTIDYGSYTNEDEMSMAYLMQIPWFHFEYPWTSTDGQGHLLVDMELSPQSLGASHIDTVATHSTTYINHAPIGYLSQFFRFWRGGFDITLKFIKTKMHSGKVQVVWTPITAVTTGANITNSSYSLRAIVDIKTEDEITLTLPFMAFTDYLSTARTGGPSLPKTSGRLQIHVLNDLRGPESVSQEVGMQLFIRGSKDFEYAVPYNNEYSIIPYIPQSGKSEVMHGSNTGLDIADDTIGSASMRRDETFHAERCVGEKLMSVKQLMLRNTPLYNLASAHTWTSAFGMLPHFLPSQQMNGTTGVMTQTKFGGDMMGLLAPMYAFIRGSVNIMVTDVSSTKVNWRFGNVPGFNLDSNAVTQPAFTPSASGNTAGYIASTLVSSGNSTNNVISMNNVGDNDLAYQHIPYYNALPMTLTAQYNGIEQINDPSIPYSVFGMTMGTTPSFPLIQRAVGDDFSCHFFICCPPIARTYS
jgi:hypothetical protein